LPGRRSSGTFGSHCDPIVTVTDVAVGPLRVATLDVTRLSPIPQRPGNLLGMDVLQRYRCLFRLQAGVLDVEAPAADRGGRELRMDSPAPGRLAVRLPCQPLDGDESLALTAVGANLRVHRVFHPGRAGGLWLRLLLWRILVLSQILL
jgi:hypothetical protein